MRPRRDPGPAPTRPPPAAHPLQSPGAFSSLRTHAARSPKVLALRDARTARDGGRAGRQEMEIPTFRIPVHLLSWSLDWKFHCSVAFGKEKKGKESK